MKREMRKKKGERERKEREERKKEKNEVFQVKFRNFSKLNPELCNQFKT